MVPQWQTGIVKRIEQATPNTRRYWVELPEASSFAFKPGQFVTLDIPIHEQRNKRWRSYSIASMPDMGNLIELVIVNLKEGKGSQYIFDHFDVGSPVTLRGPQGIFVLPEQLGRDLYLICTGTGIAPYRSMLQYIHHHNIPHRQINLIFGTRTREDLLYADEMMALERDMPLFSYYPTLSRESWQGLTGYVHPVYEKMCRDCPPALFMLCGWRAMIDEAKARLLGMGYEKKDIHSELYG